MVIEIDLNKPMKPYGHANKKAITKDERQQLFNAFEDDNIKAKRNRAILGLCALAGLRVSESCQVRKEWLRMTKFGEREVLEINIPEKDSDLRNGNKDFKTKSREARSTYIFDLKEAYFLKFFFDNHNLAMSRRAIEKRVRLWNKIINRDKNFICPHALRSSATNYLIFEIKLPVDVVQILLGHKDPKTTNRHYKTLGKAQASSFLEGFLKNETNR